MYVHRCMHLHFLPHLAALGGKWPFASNHSIRIFSIKDARVLRSDAAAFSAASLTSGSTRIPIAAVRAMFAIRCKCLQIAVDCNQVLLIAMYRR